MSVASERRPSLESGRYPPRGPPSDGRSPPPPFERRRFSDDNDSRDDYPAKRPRFHQEGFDNNHPPPGPTDRYRPPFDDHHSGRRDDAWPPYNGAPPPRMWGNGREAGRPDFPDFPRGPPPPPHDMRDRPPLYGPPKGYDGHADDRRGEPFPERRRSSGDAWGGVPGRERDPKWVPPPPPRDSGRPTHDFARAEWERERGRRDDARSRPAPPFPAPSQTRYAPPPHGAGDVQPMEVDGGRFVERSDRPSWEGERRRSHDRPSERATSLLEKPHQADRPSLLEKPSLLDKPSLLPAPSESHTEATVDFGAFPQPMEVTLAHAPAVPVHATVAQVPVAEPAAVLHPPPQSLAHPPAHLTAANLPESALSRDAPRESAAPAPTPATLEGEKARPLDKGRFSWGIKVTRKPSAPETSPAKPASDPVAHAQAPADTKPAAAASAPSGEVGSTAAISEQQHTVKTEPHDGASPEKKATVVRLKVEPKEEHGERLSPVKPAHTSPNKLILHLRGPTADSPSPRKGTDSLSPRKHDDEKGSVRDTMHARALLSEMAKVAPPRVIGGTREERFASLVRVETSHNGGASVFVVVENALESLPKSEWQAFAESCSRAMLSEEKGVPRFVMGIFRGGGKTVKNVFRSIVASHPTLPINVEAFGQPKMTQTMTMAEYAAGVSRTYNNGTHRAGGLRTISLVGTVNEERGGYFEDAIREFENNPYMASVLPWGPLSACKGIAPDQSDDGPILWVRPGEQFVPLTELSALDPKKAAAGEDAASKRKRRALESLAIRPRVERPREKLVEDRTGCHADHAGLFPDRHTIAAVGLLQSCEPPEKKKRRRKTGSESANADSGDETNSTCGGNDPSEIGSECGADTPLPFPVDVPMGDEKVPLEVKDAICFHGSDMERVGEIIGLDFNEEPMDQLIDSQCWVEDAKLNQMRRMGIRYSRVRLAVDDIYILPRKVVHQFKTVGACVSVTWHLKYAPYYPNGLSELAAGGGGMSMMRSS